MERTVNVEFSQDNTIYTEQGFWNLELLTAGVIFCWEEPFSSITVASIY